MFPFTFALWPATLLWFLAQWLIASSIEVTNHVISSLLSFPAYIFASLEDGASNWRHFFVVEVPEHLAAASAAIMWFTDTIVGAYENAVNTMEDTDFHLTYTLPSEFHDTFGNLLGDLSPEDWRYACYCFTGALAFLGYLAYKKRKTEDEAALPSSPTMMAEEGKADSSSDPLPPVSMSHLRTPTEPIEFKHFGTKDYFLNRPYYYSEQHRAPSHTPVRDTLRAEAPFELPEEAQGAAMAAREPVPFLEVPKPSREIMDIVKSPTEHVPVPMPDYSAAVAPPSYEDLVAAPQPPVSIEPEVPSLEMVYQALAMRSGELKMTLEIFLVKANNFEDISQEVSTLRYLIGIAAVELMMRKAHLTAQEASLFHWASLLGEFWTVVQPKGYSLVSSYGDEMFTFLLDIVFFGRYLGLQLLDLDMTPPPPPPQILQSPRLPPPTQAPSAYTAFAAPSNTATMAVSFDFQPTPAAARASRQPPKHIGTSKGTKAVQAASKPLQDKPQSTLTLSVPVPSITTIQDLKGQSFEDNGFWAQMPIDALCKLVREDFSWPEDDATNKKIWQFSAEEELRVTSSAVQWQNANFVEAELKSKAPAFKRATFVLRMQAFSGPPQKHTASPSLLGDITNLIHTAVHMTMACGRMNTNQPLEPWDDWYEACGYFHNEVSAEEPVLEPLYKAYGKLDMDHLQELWQAHEVLWLGEDVEP